MVGDIPTDEDRGKVNMKRIMSSLPDVNISNMQLRGVWIASHLYGVYQNLVQMDVSEKASYLL